MNKIWIYDSGAYEHYLKSDKSLFDAKDIYEWVAVGNGESIKVTKVGSLKCQVVQTNESSVNVTLKEVEYVPESCLICSASIRKQRKDLIKTI
jgi:predicted carbohydrate-binding protein with CBM5 and CBM33 domain